MVLEVSPEGLGLSDGNVSFYLRSAEIASLIATSISRDRSFSDVFFETSFISSQITNAYIRIYRDGPRGATGSVGPTYSFFFLSLCFQIVEFFQGIASVPVLRYRDRRKKHSPSMILILISSNIYSGPRGLRGFRGRGIKSLRRSNSIKSVSSSSSSLITSLVVAIAQTLTVPVHKQPESAENVVAWAREARRTQNSLVFSATSYYRSSSL